GHSLTKKLSRTRPRSGPQNLAVDVCPRQTSVYEPRRVATTDLLVILLSHLSDHFLESKKSFTIGTITSTRLISVTCVESGKIANLDAERGCISPWIFPPPFRRYISAIWSSLTPSASPKMKSIGACVA